MKRVVKSPAVKIGAKRRRLIQSAVASVLSDWAINKLKKPWSRTEEEKLRSLLGDKIPIDRIAGRLKRPASAVRNKARSLGLK